MRWPSARKSKPTSASPKQSFEQRWQQEMLRREAEQLQRQMEEMAKERGQQGQPGIDQIERLVVRAQGNSQQQDRLRRAARRAAPVRKDSKGSSHSDQRVQQALRRLQEASDAMKRSGGAQPNPEAAREAAEALRQAENLLGSTQQQLASGKLDSLSHEACAPERRRACAGRTHRQTGRPTAEQQSLGPDDTMARMRERDRLAQDRQQLSNDLSKLQKNMRDGAREMAPNQPGAAKQLRDALTEMDNADLDNHTQRTADWLRRGINPNANGTEGQIAQGLDKLKEQLQQAQQAMNDEKGGPRGPGREPGQSIRQRPWMPSSACATRSSR